MMNSTTRSFLLALVMAAPATLHAANNQILGWNNLGMHCMDSDYSVFSILPPQHDRAQLIVNRLITNDGLRSYHAIADPGSINRLPWAGQLQSLTRRFTARTCRKWAAGWSMPGAATHRKQ
jgi:hypothetical protein